MKARVLLAAVVIAISAGGVQAGAPGPIAFVRGRHIYSMDPATGFEVRVTSAAARHRHPRYSPDGTRLLYASYREGRWDLYVAAADGSGEAALTADDLWERDARWSPDGASVVYSAGRALWIVEVAGAQARRLTTSGTYHSPLYSSDGSRIVAVNNHSERDSSIEVVTESGTIAQVTATRGYEFWPSWSAAGTSIAYARRAPAGYRVWVASSDGSTAARLTVGPGDDVEPLFSPAADVVAFIRVQDDVGNLFVYDVAGGTTRSLTAFTTDGVRAFTWAPDGTQIAFTSGEGARPELYVVGADGSGMRQLTTTGAGEIQADWGTI